MAHNQKLMQRQFLADANPKIEETWSNQIQHRYGPHVCKCVEGSNFSDVGKSLEKARGWMAAGWPARSEPKLIFLHPLLVVGVAVGVVVGVGVGVGVLGVFVVGLVAKAVLVAEGAVVICEVVIVIVELVVLLAVALALAFWRVSGAAGVVFQKPAAESGTLRVLFFWYEHVFGLWLSLFSFESSLTKGHDTANFDWMPLEPNQTLANGFPNNCKWFNTFETTFSSS